MIGPGLIIGPRGNTQKRMERETDCKIAIRGKGSVKEGARRGPMAIDEDDELHVYVSGETEEAVEKVTRGGVVVISRSETGFAVGKARRCGGVVAGGGLLYETEEAVDKLCLEALLSLHHLSEAD